MNGKGYHRRAYNGVKYRRNFDAIFCKRKASRGKPMKTREARRDTVHK